PQNQLWCHAPDCLWPFPAGAAHSMRASAQVMAPGAVTSMIVAVSTRPNRQNRNRCSRMSVNQPSGEFGLRMYCSILSGSLAVLTRKGGECNQSCQQYRSNNSISPKPATKRFLIFRIELLIFVDEFPAHQTPPANKLKSLGRILGTESGEMCVSDFTLRTIIILMETIKHLYKRR